MLHGTQAEGHHTPKVTPHSLEARRPDPRETSQGTRDTDQVTADPTRRAREQHTEGQAGSLSQTVGLGTSPGHRTFHFECCAPASCPPALRDCHLHHHHHHLYTFPHSYF
uniref:Uncharacterized protein n=1 Tax=Cacopsylla melanoneura TaxID=428564 RepID=A0A8D8Y220_9HEMI